ncbi:hypothetical protein ZIOFF_018594 [Zingiber officinale]|uniref:TRF2/HOY1 PH-like domain-containing protein n=1 Tax=Zingiber officinale TaxID=94328 RepID=A0A8J5LMB5_ZINOF|nr:hypothetical protein ZIOFF_018594 [Zingiber officinale]
MGYSDEWIATWAKLGVLGFLLWISSGGMVWSSDSGKRRANSTLHSTPPPPTVKLEVEEPLDEKRVHLHKRARDVSTLCEQVDPSLSLLIMFVSLSPRKSPSLADMIQMMLSQAKTVAKCYFAKRKLVWEVLEGGLKSKVEFNWSNFTAIKAVFFEGDHGTLDILARPPLFFRATDPQPRKHTLWQATRDFTNGQEYIHSLSTNKVEELASGNTSLPCDALFDKEITDFIAQFFDNDSQSSAQAGVGSDDEPYSTLEAEVSFLEFLIVSCCDKS